MWCASSGKDIISCLSRCQTASSRFSTYLSCTLVIPKECVTTIHLEIHKKQVSTRLVYDSISLRESSVANLLVASSSATRGRWCSAPCHPTALVSKSHHSHALILVPNSSLVCWPRRSLRCFGSRRGLGSLHAHHPLPVGVVLGRLRECLLRHREKVAPHVHYLWMDLLPPRAPGHWAFHLRS